MYNKLGLCFVILVYSSVIVTSNQNCNRCLNNRAYCIDEKRYRFCFKDRNPSTQIQTCGPNEYCTTAPVICAKKPFATGVGVGCEKSCGVCRNNAFTCTSTTEFGLCVGGQIVQTYNCAPEQVCSNELLLLPNYNDICADQATLDKNRLASTCTDSGTTTTPTATTDIPTTTTPTNTQTSTETTSTTSPSSSDAYVMQCTAAQPDHVGKSTFFIRNTADETCKTYIYCEIINNAMEAVFLKCNTGYFDETTNKCETTQPNSCTAAKATKDFA